MLENDFHEDMLRLYRDGGLAVGYWARRYKQAVIRRGGLPYARHLLKPRRPGKPLPGVWAACWVLSASRVRSYAAVFVCVAMHCLLWSSVGNMWFYRPFTE